MYAPERNSPPVKPQSQWRSDPWRVSVSRRSDLLCIDSQSKVLWQREHKVDPQMASFSQGNDEPATAQLNEVWGKATEVIVNSLPYFVSRNGETTLPAPIVLDPNGVK